MACKLNELREALQTKAVKGEVEGIPLDIAVIRLTAAVTKMQVTQRLKDTENKFDIAKEMYEASISAKAMKKLEGEKPEIILPSNTTEEKLEFDKLPAFNTNKKTMTYAGIGSRQTPAHILKKMTEIATYLEKQGYTLNTGVTFRGKEEEGADKAFSDGTKKKNLFSPEKQGSRALEQTIAKELHPAPHNLTEGVLKLMARNTNQVFGDDLETPVDFVLFYAKETKGIRPEGGTGQAVEMARLKGIPTVNMAIEGWETELRKVLGMKVKEPKVETTLQDRVEGVLKLTNGRITFKNGAVTKEVSSLDELVEIASNLDELVDKGGNKYDLTHMYNMFTLMKNAGVKFNKVRLDLGEATMLPGNALGWYTVAKGSGAAHMQLRANRKFVDVSPMQVLLHEYVHHITLKHLGENKELVKEVEALMNHIRSEKPELAKEYAFTNAGEFLAEVVAEPRLKEMLKDIPPLKGKESVWNALKSIFKELLESLRVKDVKEINAYTEAMELVLRIVDKEDGKQEVDDKVPLKVPTNNTINIYSLDKNGYEQLSNLLAGPVKYKGKTYYTIEQAYQHQKAEFAGDRLVGNRILDARTSLDAKTLGKTINGLDVKEWDKISSNILKSIMTNYYESNEAGKNLLLGTVGKTLTHKATNEASLGKWENEFPRLLTEIRDELDKFSSQPNEKLDDKAPWEDESQEETLLSSFYREKYVQPTLIKGQTFAHVSNAKFDKFAVAGDVLPDGWEFNTLGSHIGDSETVDEYAKQLDSKDPSYVYDVKVKENANVLEMKDPGDSNWTADNMYDQLAKKFGEVSFTKDSKAKEVLDFLRSKGYDAVGYVNTEEGGVSYMVLSPDKFELKLRTPIATKGKVSFSENLLQSINKCNK